jgi:bacillithiol synthase
MFDCIPSNIFFRSERPSCLPGDSNEPDLNSLIKRVKNFDSSNYPLHEIKNILERENSLLGGDTAVTRLKALGDDPVFIITGQQAGLFGGPLYTLYKAMHTVRLAEILTEKTGRTVAPLFWVASDDHDFGEVSGIGVRSREGGLKRLEYIPENYTEGVPVGEITLDNGILQAVESFTESNSGGAFAEKFINIIRESWVPGRKWNEAFSIQMSHLFNDYGLIFIDPRWHGIKKLFSNITSAEIENPLKTTELVNLEAEKLKNVGVARPLQKPESSTNLFIELEGIRYPVKFENGVFFAGEKSFTKHDLLTVLENLPEKISPGAALRPVCQDYFLPVAAQICGPGERIYISQLNPVYKLLGVKEPVLWPRASFTVADPKIIRISEKENIPPEKLFYGADRIISEMSLNTFPPEIESRINDLEKSTGEGFGKLADEITTLDPTLADSVKKDMGKTLFIIDKIRERALRSHKSRMDLKKNRIASTTDFLAPQNKPQERWFGIDSILSVLENGGFEEIINLASPQEELHRIIITKGI